MSADGAPVVDSAPADGGADLGGGVPLGGTVGDIRDALGFDYIEDLAPDSRPDVEPTADEGTGRNDKGQFEAEVDKADKPKVEDKTEDDDVAQVKAIEARAKARRKAAAEARKGRELATAPKVQAEAPKAAEAKPTREATPVETAVRDVLAQIERLATGDAGNTEANEPTPDTSERKKLLAGIEAKLDSLQQGLKTSEEGTKRLEEMQAQLKAIENDRIVRQHVIKAVDPILDELPTLSDPKAIRAFNKANGTTYADSVEMVAAAAERYWTKFQAKPDMADLARRIERKLKGDSAEPATEKPKAKSNTVSRSDGSPPAARSGPDDRTAEEAIADFNKRFGIE